MKGFNSFVNEVFDTKTKLDKTFFTPKYIDDGWAEVKFQLDNSIFRVSFFYLFNEEIWNIEFSRSSETSGHLSAFEIWNDATVHFRIFGVVLDVILEFVKMADPDKFRFTASEPSRAKLYTRMAQTLKSKIPNYKLEITSDEYHKGEFTFSKKVDDTQPVVVESTNMDSAVELLRNAIKGTEFDNRLYIAGGFVRDELLGLDSKDIDFVVDGGPDAGMEAATFIAKKLGVYKPESNPVLFPTYGTAKLTIPVDGKSIDVEFVAPRKERYEPGSRKPSVSPGTLKDDALRRDFTINALFKNLTTGEILDLSGKGRRDLDAKVLNTTGDPDWIFSEDPLRILRAVRFTLKYDLKLPLTVIRAIKKAAPSLANISAERIQDELKKILVLAKPSKAIRLFKITGILDQILPELKALDKLKQNVYHTKDALGHTLDVLDNTPANFYERLAALFHDIGKAATRTEQDGKVRFIGHADIGADLTKGIMKRLKYSNEDIEKVSKIVRHHMDLKSVGAEAEGLKESTLRKFIYRVAAELEPILNVIHADNIAHAPGSTMPNQIEKIREKIATLNVDDILNTKSILDGNEIMELGAKGKLIGDIKDRILTKSIENPAFTREQAINLAQNMIKDSNK